MQPNDWQKQIRTATQAGAVSGKGALYVQFWGRFLERVHAERPDWTGWRAVGPAELVRDDGARSRGCIISSSFAQGDRLRHELYIDTGDGERNDEIFEYLRNQQEQIEAAYGQSSTGMPCSAAKE